jgi:flavin-dependent dehydrogenase
MKVDVIVAGGGPSGMAAAVAAARNGADVLLVKKLNFIGGLLASGLPIIGHHNRHGKQVVFGLAQEIVERLKKNGGSLGFVMDPRYPYLPVDPEMVKQVLLEVIEESNVKILFQTFAGEAIVKDS